MGAATPIVRNVPHFTFAVANDDALVVRADGPRESVLAKAAATITSARIGATRSVTFFILCALLSCCPVCLRSLIGPRGGIPLWVEDAEHAHLVSPGVLEAVLDEWREVHARPAGDRRLLPVEVQDALPLDHVDDLVVRVAVHRRAPRRDQADELRPVPAAAAPADQERKPAVLPCGELVLLPEAARPPLARGVTRELGRGDGDEQKVVRPGVV